jgi:5-methylcytosine-specific restriction endonuclease McrA
VSLYVRKTRELVKCSYCNVVFLAATVNSKHCSVKCRDKARYYANENRRYAANPEMHKAATLRWQGENKEHRSEYAQKWRLANRESELEKERLYAKTNRPIKRAQEEARRARKANALGYFTESEWQAILRNQWYLCAKCGIKAPLQKDHIVPLARGGCNYAFNIQGLCSTCNNRKNAKMEDVVCLSLFDRVYAKETVAE